MSDDDPVEVFVEGSVEPFGESEEADEYGGPKARDMEAELRERTGVDADGSTAEAEISSEAASAFWAAVIYVNAGLLLVALGPVVYALRGLQLVSVALVAGGAIAFLRAYSVYRAFDADDDSREDPADGDDGGDDRDTDDNDDINDGNEDAVADAERDED